MRAPPIGRSRLIGMSAEDAFDLSASGLRADGSDLRISIEVLASKLEASLPALTRVERRGSGLFGRGSKHVHALHVSLGEDSYQLSRTPESVQCTRERRVGGIAIKRERLDPDQWVSALTTEIGKQAQQSAEARAALKRLLG
jgi:hypothetical protein